MNKRIVYLILLALFPLWSLSQATLTHSSKSMVRVGEQFQVSFELNADGNKFKGPNFDGFAMVGGPYSSTSSNISVVNGSVKRSMTTTYSYIIRALKEGDFTISEASVNVDGKKIVSEPFTIKVVKGNSASVPNGSTNAKQQNNDAGDIDANDVFLRAIVSKENTYVGEQIVITYRIYSRVSIASMNISNSPTYGGFWTKNMSDNSGSLQRSTEVVNGQEYTVADIQKIALFPQKSGKLTIDPMEIECLVQIRKQRQRSNDPFDVFFNDPFFNTNVSTIKKFIKTQPIAINVKPLPTANKPQSFNGAVGQFSFKSGIDKTDLKANEAFTITNTISGRGNIDLLEMPKPNFPPDFEVYEPKITLNTQATASGIQGVKKAEYLVIPRAHGDFVIPETHFSYFDPARNTYVKLSSSAYNIKVQKSNIVENGEIVHSVNQEDIKYIGQDIQHIMTKNLHLRRVNTTFFASTAFWIVLVLLLALFVAAIIVAQRQEKFRQNESLVRNKKATKIAIGRLKNAHKYMIAKNQDEFYVEMSQALWGYISDKLSIERSNLSMDTVKATLTEKQLPNELIEEFIDTLNDCEFARFAPGDASKKMDDIYKKGIAVITKTEKLL